MPAMYASRIYAVAGGLMSYDASVLDSMRQVGVYIVVREEFKSY